MKKAIFGIVAMLILSVVAVGTLAMPGLGKRGELRNNPNNDAMVAALEAGDYEAYIAALEESDRVFMAEKVTEEQFNLRVERYKEREERKAEMEEQKKKIDEAMEEGYDSWYTLVSELEIKPRLFDQITEENFDKFIALHEAKEEGDFETVKTLEEELGIEHPGNRHDFAEGRCNQMLQGKKPFQKRNMLQE